ncbi:MAG: hypothetical protein AB7E34_09710 [Acidaminococcaceae bacterium]
MNYTIKKGKHFSQFTWNRLWPFVPKVIRGNIKFGDECGTAYVQQPGWNKVTGISSLQVHRNSVRIVWQPAGYQMVRVAFYAYINGKRHIIELGTLSTNYQWPYKIEMRDMNYTVTLGFYRATLFGKKVWPRFRCFPYFGGRSTAPADINITIN